MKARYYTTVELAKKTGVSRQVISAILNETWKEKRISEATYKRIQVAINELGYVPDKTAIALKKSPKNFTGIIYHGPLHSHILIAIQKLTHHFNNNNISVKIVISRENGLKDGIQDLMGYRVQKIVILLSSLIEDFSKSDLEQKSMYPFFNAIPIIIYNFPFHIHEEKLEKVLTHSGCQLVGFSRPNIYKKLLKELLSKGKKRLLIDQKIIQYLEQNKVNSRLLKQFKSVRLFPSKKFQNIDQNRYLVGENLASTILKLLKKESSDTIITDSDMIAQGLANRLLASGIEVPQEIQIIGFDNIDALPFFSIPLPSIEVPVKQMIKTVIDLLQKNNPHGQAFQARAKLKFPSTY